MFRRIFLSAVIAGILSGSAITLVQHFTTTPIILHAETFENISDGGDKHGALKKGVALISPAHAHGPHKDTAKLAAGNWAPDDGLERTIFTFLTNIITGVGFALVLTACFALSKKRINGRIGVLWGLGAFAIVSLAPALGLPPEVPGAMTAELTDRQFWWFLCVAFTGSGLWVMIFRNGAIWAASGALLIALPHILGAPIPDYMGGPVPPELAAQFVSASLATAAIFWCTTGWLAGTFWNKSGPKNQN